MTPHAASCCEELVFSTHVIKYFSSLKKMKRKAANTWVIEAAFRMAAKDQEFKAHVVQAAKEKKADDLAQVAASMHPANASENVTLSALSAIPQRIGRHMKVAELREECKLRKLDATGLKDLLVARLDSYKLEGLTTKDEKAYVSAQVAACFLYFVLNGFHRF